MRSDLSGIALLDGAPESEGIDLRAVRAMALAGEGLRIVGAQGPVEMARAIE